MRRPHICPCGTGWACASYMVLLAHLRSTGREDDARRLANSDDLRVIGWGAWDRTPNRLPWEHAAL